jgi:hypothetical protein
VTVCDPDDLLDLLDALGHQHGRRGELVRARVLEGVAVELQVNLAGQHPRAPQRGGKLIESGRQRRLG